MGGYRLSVVDGAGGGDGILSRSGECVRLLVIVIVMVILLVEL